MKKPILLTDVDGVLLDWVKTFGEYAKSQGFKLRMPHPQTWEMTEWFGADHGTIRRLITEMNTSKIFAEIPPFQDAMKVLPELEKTFDLVAITCCSTDPVTVERRKKNLELLNVNFKEVHCLNFTDSKKELLASYDNTFWIEDRFKGAKEGIETGHKSILINRSYNQDEHHEDLIRVNNWEQILFKVKKGKVA